MAQLFKTISLEERLKNSSYNNVIQQPKAVQQGSVTIQPYQTNLSLANNSPIEITPFGIFNHTSNILIQPYNTIVTQGGVSPTIFNFNPTQGGLTPLLFNYIPNQGGVNPTIITFTPNQGGLTPILFSFSPSQGHVNLFPYNYTPIQGGTTLTSYLFTPIQGGLNPTTITFVPYQGIVKPPPHLFVPNQGSAILTPYQFTPIQGGLSPIIINSFPYQGGLNPTTITFTPTQGGMNPVFIGFIPNQGGILPGPYKPGIEQGGFLPSKWGPIINQGEITLKTYAPANNQRLPTDIYLGYTGAAAAWLLSSANNVINPTAKQGSIILNVLRYEADRALAAFTPAIKHGGYSTDSDRELLESRLLIEEYKDLSTRPASPSGEAYTNLLPADTTVVPTIYKAALEDEMQETIYRRLDREIGKFITSDYAVRSYYQLGEEAKKQDAKKTINSNTSLTLRTGTTSADSRGKTDVGEPEKDVDDFITFKINSLRDASKFVSFKAYLTAFNDSYTVNWNDINYVGRQETLKAFKGVTRGVSLSFKTAALTRKDMEYMYKKLNRLVQIAAVGAVDGGTYVKGPICSLTLGKWFVNTPCVFNSVKFDIQPTEYSWDVGIPNTVDGIPGVFSEASETKYELPHIVDVSLDVAILLTNDKTAYNSTANFFSEIPTYTG